MSRSMAEHLNEFTGDDFKASVSMYVGMKSTKLYCHSTCQQAKAENSIVFSSRYEAERLGFRPCQSCFSSLPIGVWRDHKEYMLLKAPEDFRFSVNLRYLNRSQDERLHKVENNKVYKVLELNHTDVLVEVSSWQDRILIVRFVGGTSTKQSIRVAAASYVWDWFDLDRNLTPFYQMGRTDPILSRAVQDFRGLRLIGVTDLFEALCWTIIGQQINLPFAYTLKRRVVELSGRHVMWRDQPYWLFPTPEKVAALSLGTLRSLQFTTRKAEYLIGLAKNMINGRVSRDTLLLLKGYPEIGEELQRIRGIGPWSAHYVLMRHFKDPCAMPIQDVGLQNAVKLARQMEHKPSKDELVELTNGWDSWKAYATFYLWMTLSS